MFSFLSHSAFRKIEYILHIKEFLYTKISIELILKSQNFLNIFIVILNLWSFQIHLTRVVFKQANQSIPYWKNLKYEHNDVLYKKRSNFSVKGFIINFILASNVFTERWMHKILLAFYEEGTELNLIFLLLYNWKKYC